MGENVIIHDAIVPPRKSSRMMTNLSGRECHNHAMKMVSCDPHMQIAGCCLYDQARVETRHVSYSW